MSKKVKSLVLFCIFAWSMSIPYYAISAGTDTLPENNQVNNQSSWKEKLFWVLIPVFVQVTLVHLILPLLDKFQSQQQRDLQKLRNLTMINKELKIQLNYVKTHCRNKKLVKELENSYLESCIKLMEFQKKYYKKHGKK